MAKIIDGKALALQIQQQITQEIKEKELTPNLAVILIGNDPASKIYINLKKNACQQVGIEFHEYLLDKNSNTEDILKVIDFLNKDKNIDAILVQLPLPQKFDTDQIIQAIDPQKDVDGFHKTNIDNLLNKQSGFIPGLPLGIIKLLESTNEDLTGKTAVILAKSEILYRPLAKLLNDKGIQTQIVNPTDQEVKNKSLQADILIVACGKAFFVTADMVKDQAMVIDVGTNKIDKDYIVGDVDYTDVFKKASHITPVPGGVGPMTVAMLLYNTVKLAENRL